MDLRGKNGSRKTDSGKAVKEIKIKKNWHLTDFSPQEVLQLKILIHKIMGCE